MASSVDTPGSPTSSTSSLMMSTNTLLAVPDGPISASSSDLKNHAVSYIGGYPTFPSFPPSSSSSTPPSQINCGTCHKPIPLLTQVYCPPEGGENDRTVYVFACPRASCARRDASIRAFRASVRNEDYVRDVIETRKKREAEEAAEREREKERAKINPFSMGTAAASGGLGSALFGSGSGSAFGSEATASSMNPFAANSEEDDSSKAASEAFAGLSLSHTAPAASPATPSAGPSTPAVTYGPPLPAYQPPQYLSTFDEYIPRPDKAAASKLAQVDDGPGEKAGRKASAAEEARQGGGGGGGAEQWERVLPKGVDEVFERFVNRLYDAEGGEDQVLRYDLGATPLPYSSHSSLYQKLFPKTASAKPGESVHVTRSSAYAMASPPKREQDKDDEDDPDSDDEEASELEHRYHPEAVVPPCPRCGGERVFEMQLVPGLISVLKPESLTTEGIKKKKKSKKVKQDQSAEERQKEIAAMLAGKSGEASEEGLEVSEAGMEWGTVMVFGCKKDCVGFGEEWVGVEWEEAS